MSRLAELQTDFQAYVFGAPNAAVARVVDAGRLNADQRLQVYAEAYRLRLIEALETDFIALRAHLGENEFNALATAYIAASPSTHYSVRYFGTRLADFLARTAPYAKRPVLAELAAFDWALTTAFDAADDPILAADDLATIAPENWPTLRFRGHSSVVRLDLQWNAPAIWRAADNGDSLPAPERSATKIPWVIWRQNLSTYFRSLAPHEGYALDACLRGDTFAEICEGLCEWIEPDDAAATAAGLLRQWLADGMLCEFSS